MKNEERTVSVEFTEEEIDDLIEELISANDLLTKATDEQIRDLHKNENEDVQQMYVNLHNARIKTINDTLNKLMAKSDYYSVG